MHPLPLAMTMQGHKTQYAHVYYLHRFPNKICVIVQSQLTQEPPVLAEAEAQVPDGDISLAAGPILTAHLPEGPQPHLEIDEPLRMRHSRY